MNAYWQQVTETARQVPAEELRPLLRHSDLQGWLAVITTYGIVAFSFALVHFRPSVLTILVALVLIGGRQLALAILAHEAAHKTLFASKRINEWVGKWLCGYPMGIDLIQYRAEHLQHHQKTGTDEDPDLGLVTPYPVGRSSMVRKLIRDLFGLTTLKRVPVIVMMGLGMLTYSLSTNAKPIDQTGRTAIDYLKSGLAHFHGVLITNAILFAILFLLGVPWLFTLWIGAYFSTFNVFARIRSLSEHACTPDQTNALLNTRTTLASPLARVTVAPHRVNYHLEHHLFMQVPFYNLKRLHGVLKRHGIADKGCISKNYIETFQLALKCST